MARKSLSTEQIQRMKDLLQEGKLPEDISKEIGVAVSSVNNYKKRFRDEGVVMPSKRADRVKKSKKIAKDTPVHSIGQITASVSEHSRSTQAYRFIVNGVSVEISGQAKNINIGPNRMEISF
jgi:predicted transcriptional regulator